MSEKLKKQAKTAKYHLGRAAEHKKSKGIAFSYVLVNQSMKSADSAMTKANTTFDEQLPKKVRKKK